MDDDVEESPVGRKVLKVVHMEKVSRRCGLIAPSVM